MFNQNSVVAAYPYAANNQSSNNYPIFNVVQLLINPTTGLIDTSTTCLLYTSDAADDC